MMQPRKIAAPHKGWKASAAKTTAKLELKPPGELLDEIMQLRNQRVFLTKALWEIANGPPDNGKHLAEVATLALTALSIPTDAAAARSPNQLKDPRDVILDQIEGGLLLLIDALKAGDPPNEIIYRVQEELRLVRTRC